MPTFRKRWRIRSGGIKGATFTTRPAMLPKLIQGRSSLFNLGGWPLDGCGIMRRALLEMANSFEMRAKLRKWRVGYGGVLYRAAKSYGSRLDRGRENQAWMLNIVNVYQIRATRTAATSVCKSPRAIASRALLLST